MSSPSVAQRFFRRLRGGGARWLAGALRDRVWPPRLEMTAAVLRTVEGHCGLEVGGPSRVFGPRGLVPVYRHAARIDNVNFATHTAWEPAVREGGKFIFDPRRPPGTQWIREARTLKGIADAGYDFVISSHCLEHLANPLGALREWRRATRSEGHALVIVPDRERSFDHRRPVTTLSHLREDEARDTGEDDRTHIAEAQALHDLDRDPGAGSAEEFQARLERNFENRCLHHHVFDLALLRDALSAAGWRVLATERARPVHLVAWAQNSRP